MLIYFEYSVQVYDDDLQKLIEYCGITCAKDYASAAQEVVDFYGDIEELRLSEWDAQGCLSMSKEVLKELRDYTY